MYIKVAFNSKFLITILQLERSFARMGSIVKKSRIKKEITSTFRNQLGQVQLKLGRIVVTWHVY